MVDALSDQFLVSVMLLTEPSLNLTQQCATGTAVIVEDHEAIAQMIRQTLVGHFAFEQGMVMSSFTEALRRIPSIAPNLVILDNHLEDGRGIDLLRIVRTQTPNTRWLLYTGYASARTLSDAIDAGVDGAVAKKAPLSVFITAVNSVLMGCKFFCEITSKEIRSHEQQVSLNPTERKIIEYIASGMDAKEIAAIIGVAHKTVLNSMVAIRKKTNTVSMVQISDYGRRHGISHLNI